MQLTDALIKEFLRELVGGRHWEVNVASALHEDCFLPRAFIESLAMRGMARLRSAIRGERRDIIGARGDDADGQKTSEAGDFHEEAMITHSSTQETGKFADVATVTERRIASACLEITRLALPAELVREKLSR